MYDCKFLVNERRLPVRQSERRVTERTIKDYQKLTEFSDEPPTLHQLEIGKIPAEMWENLFVISCDEQGGQHVFLAYGGNFAHFLELPETTDPSVLVADQLPSPYRAVFTRGCQDAIAARAPVRLEGVLELSDGRLVQYRGAFMPIWVRPDARTHLVYGAFSGRRVDSPVGSF